MKRLLAIWLPNWPRQRLANDRRKDSGDPYTDRQALIRLAQWCHQFAPTVGLEEGDAPETLLLDVTNLAPLYGGEERLVAQVCEAFQRRGFEARVALADTLGAAWGLAHFAQGGRESFATSNVTCSKNASSRKRLPTPAMAVPFSIIPPDQSRRALEPLPIAALRLPEDMLLTLTRLGVDRIAALLTLPREQLRSRFGPLLALRIDQALGTAREVFSSVEPPERFVVEQPLEFPLARQDDLRAIIEMLLERLAWLLAARSAGALLVTCRLDCEGTPPVAVEASLFQPTANARHLLELIDLEMERTRLPAPATAITIEATASAPLAQRQTSLFDEDRTLGGSPQLNGLVNRLTARLGREAVVRCRLEREAQPELAYREIPLVNGASLRVAGHPSPKASRRSSVAAALGPLDRPLYLLNRPVPIEAIAVAPDGPPRRFRRDGQQHDVARHWGPERIETGWWRGRAAGRDYYQVETTEGRRYWLYRRRRDGRWFLHGVYE